MFLILSVFFASVDVHVIMGDLGFILSAILSIVQLKESWQARSHFDTCFDFSDVDHGNRIDVVNLSTKPQTILYWELKFQSKRWFNRKIADIESAQGDFRPFTLAPHQTERWSFVDANYFDSTGESLRGKNVILILRIAGHRNNKILTVYSG